MSKTYLCFSVRMPPISWNLLNSVFGEMVDFSPFGYLSVTLFRSNVHEIEIPTLLGTSGMILESISVETYYQGASIDLDLTLGEESYVAFYKLPAHSTCLKSDIIEWDILPKEIISPSTTLLLRYSSSNTDPTFILPPKVIFRFYFPSSQFQGYIPVTRLFRDCQSNTFQIHGFDLHKDDPPMRIEVGGDTVDSACDVSDGGITLCQLPEIEADFVDVQIVDESRNIAVYIRRLYFFDFPVILHKPIEGSPHQILTLSFDLGNRSFDIDPGFLFQFSHLRNEQPVLEAQTTSVFPPIVRKHVEGNSYLVSFSLPNTRGTSVTESKLKALLPNSCVSPEISRVIYTNINTPSPSPSLGPTPLPSEIPASSLPPTPAPSASPFPSPREEPIENKKPIFETLLDYIKENILLVAGVGFFVLVLIVGLCFFLCVRSCRKSKRVRSDVSYESLSILPSLSSI
eukprot:TRINITY_DN1310_c1_g1_i2.p1 TRINITY_DN1310_c1_g1~~TRINITY_DN1310_c1_g1_i2.p1  ORF type:complete len:457 (-),score=51.97 TRINITY_DN1310_c1_g1_i2:1184-2554(-)